MPIVVRIIKRARALAAVATKAVKAAAPVKKELTEAELAARAEKAAAARARAAILVGQREIEGREYALVAVPLHPEPVISKSGKVKHVAQFSGYLLELTKGGKLKRATVELEAGGRPLAGSGNIYFSEKKSAGAEKEEDEASEE